MRQELTVLGGPGRLLRGGDIDLSCISPFSLLSSSSMVAQTGGDSGLTLAQDPSLLPPGGSVAALQI